MGVIKECPSLPSLSVSLSVCLLKVVISRCPPNQTHPLKVTPPKIQKDTFSWGSHPLMTSPPHPEPNPNAQVQPRVYHSIYGHATMPCTTHASAHARPSLPDNQIPNLTLPNWGTPRLHDTAAILLEIIYFLLQFFCLNGNYNWKFCDCNSNVNVLIIRPKIK